MIAYTGAGPVVRCDWAACDHAVRIPFGATPSAALADYGWQTSHERGTHYCPQHADHRASRVWGASLALTLVVIIVWALAMRGWAW